MGKLGAPALTGIDQTMDGTPEFLVQEFRRVVREVASYLPAGQTRLSARVMVRHIKPKSTRKPKKLPPT